MEPHPFPKAQRKHEAMFKRLLRGRAEPSDKAVTATPPIPVGKTARYVSEPPLYEYLEPLIPPRERWVGPDDPFIHFLRWPIEYRAYLTILCGMRRDAAVIELGCSHGRTMLGIVDYLWPPGRYEGLDILLAEIEFAQKNITPRFPHFRFTHADIFNTLYNPRGALRPETYRFPFEDGTFDVAYAASLYSHLLPESLSNYLVESRRVLKPGGRCLFSFFLLDFYRGAGTTNAPFYELGNPLPGYAGVAVRSMEHPEEIIGYQSEVIRKVAEGCGLRVERILPGYWSQSQPVQVNEQDMILFEAI
jgi:SAM-dependent methyltransferase